ncbi:hypothetical protein WA026_001453 [Henosepilachna vigintioctopunctata]|uniref:PPPDE domain-containing protein n=1 Tax=Henosepilachna vigintioctopunctata TaxID=420089 RepID=A0AAW1UL80_9CUCU
MEKAKVELYIYDLSKGMAKTLAPMLIGKSLDGIWHTSIVVHNREYVFNSSGVEHCKPGSTHLGPPLKVELLGYTEVELAIFTDYIQSLSESTFAASTYNIFSHNCNTFSEEVAQFLVGKSIPKYILDLPQEFLSGNLSPTVLTLLTLFEKQAQVTSTSQSTEREGSPDFDELNLLIEESRYNSFLREIRRKTDREKQLKRERKREKKRKKALKEGSSISVEEEDPEMTDTEIVNGNNAGSQLPSEQALAIEEEERREEEERKKAREPPVVFTDLIDVKSEFDALIGLIDGKISSEEQRSMEELSQYMLEDEGSWALSDGFLTFVGRLLQDQAFSIEVRIRIMNILAVAALKDDVILLLHQDRKDHFLMNYAFEIDRNSIEEQRALSLFIANMFENLSSSEWLLYISEWTFKGQQISNIRVTTKVGVHCLLADDAILQDRGSAIIHNLACKEVKTVVCIHVQYISLFWQAVARTDLTSFSSIH